MNNNILEILIFNVGQAQCIFFYPRNNPEYGMLIDCAESEEFRPIDFLIKQNFIHFNTINNQYELSNLTITNYDHDHFSGLPQIRQEVLIKTTRFAKNISSQELKIIKSEITDALNHICYLKDKYTAVAVDHKPPYNVSPFSLEKKDFGNMAIDTNNLSQLVFVEYGGSKICVCGDLKKPAWDKILQNIYVQYHLKTTNILVVAHHGHEDGYHENIFLHCTNADCIVISDKDIMYDTQDSMASKYSQHISRGIIFNGVSTPRKILTTRSDGHLWISFDIFGNRTYRSFSN